MAHVRPSNGIWNLHDGRSRSGSKRKRSILRYTKRELEKEGILVLESFLSRVMQWGKMAEGDRGKDSGLEMSRYRKSPVTPQQKSIAMK